MTNFLYNPDRKSKEQLKAEFVVRTSVLDDIMQDVETSAMQTPEQHYLLVGQRGTGKTTLLHRIKYAIEDNQHLSEWLIPVIFSEEQYNISELANLWETVAHNLEDYHGFDGISKEMEEHIAKDNFEELCYDILEKYLKQYNKKLILLIDNIGDLLKKLEDKEVRRLRELLQTKAQVRLIAGSPFYLDSILDYKQPFFEFFKVIRLDGLNKQETQELLLKLGEIYNEKEKIEKIIKESPGRVETLRILTGGVPRTLALMFKIFTDYEHESSVKDLERILDLVTPLYKHRMDDLPKQQQKIVDAVARKWEAISVKELKEKVRLESKVISAQLRQLEKNQIIEKRETGTKNHNYLLKERFFNIWYLMRYGRKDTTESVKWLVSFMENWYDKNELEEKIENYVEGIMENKLNTDSAFFYANVYKAFNNLSNKAKSKLNFGLFNWEKTRTESEDGIKLKQLFVNGDKKATLKFALKLDFLSNDAKLIIFQAASILVTDSDEEFRESFFNALSKKIDNIEVDANYEITFWFIATDFWAIQSCIFNKNFEDIENIFEYVNTVIASFQDDFGHEFFKKYFWVEDRLVKFIFICLLAENQLNLVKNLFENPGFRVLKDTFKPIYLATLILDDKKIFANLGDELKIPVQSVLDDIEKRKKQNKEIKL